MTAPVVYGATLAGHDVVEVPVGLAEILAAAHRRLRPDAIGVHRGDGVVEIVHPAPAGPDGGADRWVTPSADLVAAIGAAARPVVLAGPEVVRFGAVPGLHALAASASLGVLNTWGAKGLFDWRSRHHLATAGLQARDFVEAGFADADLIVATGVDPAEAAADWRLAPVIEVHPWALAPLAELVGRPPAPIPLPPLRQGLASATQAGWQRTSTPLAPTAVTRTYGALLGGGGLVTADPGVAGFWVARTVPTTGLGGALVSSTAGDEGSALATALVALRLDPRRPVLAVVDEVGERGRAVLELAASWDISLAVECWAGDGEALDGEAHHERLGRLLATGGQVSIATDARQLDEMLAVAGPIVAWSA